MASSVKAGAPKLFISYCWSSQDWVRKLATELRENGVDAMIDIWDLKEGQDANVFMEKMVNDPEIHKVAIVCDRKYVEKADGRSGGVGTETQIISPAVYAKQDQTKFVALVLDRDEDKHAYLPAYYRSRLYIDFSSPEDYGASFDQLLRWIYNKPLHKKPELGITPAFLSEKDVVSLQTTTLHRRALDAMKEGRASSEGAILEYFHTFAQNLERLRINEKDLKPEIDDVVISRIGSFLPFRNEALQLFIAMARYRPTQSSWDVLHHFFERLIPYVGRPDGVDVWQPDTADSYKFMVHELFLYAIAVLISSSRFDGAAHLMSTRYYVGEDPSRIGASETMVTFAVFCNPVRCLARRNDRLKLNRSSLLADIIKERSAVSGLPFPQIMQADMVLYLRRCLDILRQTSSRVSRNWYPSTLVYAQHQMTPFELFARSESKQYFRNLALLLGISSPNEFDALQSALKEDKLHVPTFDHYPLRLDELVGFGKLAKLP